MVPLRILILEAGHVLASILKKLIIKSLGFSIQKLILVLKEVNLIITVMQVKTQLFI